MPPIAALRQQHCLWATWRDMLVAPSRSKMTHRRHPPFSSVGLRDYYTRCWLQEEAMRRREFITLFGGAAVAWPLTAGAQQPKKMHRIGVLWHGGNAEQEAIYLAALRQGLLDFGYVEGHNIVLEMRFPAEQYERFFVLAAELAQQNVDVLVSAAGLLPSPAIVQQRRSHCRRQCPRSGRAKAGGQP